MNFNQAVESVFHQVKPFVWRPYGVVHTVRMYLRREPLPDIPPDSPFIRSIRPDDVVLEAGTNIGGLTRILSQRAKEVHTFEPNRKALDFARKHFRGKKNVRFYCAAIGGSCGAFKLNIESDLSGSNSFHITTDNLRNMRYRKQTEAEMLTVAEFVRASGMRPTVLVLDIEGEEGAALRGAEGFLPDRVFLETHWVRKSDGSFASTLNECEGYLSERGYLVGRFADRGGYVWLSGVRLRGS